jgi:hypothetical protein
MKTPWLRRWWVNKCFHCRGGHEGINDEVKSSSEAPGKGMAEICIEPTIEEGSQRIVIRKFSLLRKEVGAEFDSPAKFSLCGEEFNLRLYPGGFNEQSNNWLGFYLKSHGDRNLPLAKSDYRIINQHDDKPDEVKGYDSPAQLAPGKLYG